MKPRPAPHVSSHVAIAAVLRRAAMPALLLFVICFFGGYAVFGRNGVLAYGDYRTKLAESEARYEALDRRRAVLRNRVALVDPRRANPDMVDELVRRELNVAHPDEMIVPLK